MRNKTILFIPSILAFTLSLPIAVQAQPPGGGGGGGGNVQDQITDLDERVGTLEGQALDSRIGILEGQSLDGRLGTLEAQNLGNRLLNLENERHGLRLDILEGQNLNTRLGALELQDLNGRITTIEDQNLDDRIANLEATSLQFLRTVLVKPVGPTEVENGAELLAAIGSANALNPSPTNPVLIKVEPGLYDITPGALGLPSFVHLQGSGRDVTRIRGFVSLNDPSRFVIVLNGNSSVRDLSIEVGAPANVFQRNTGAIRTNQDKINDLIRNVHIIGPRSSSHTGIENGSGAVTRVEDVIIDDVRFTIDHSGVTGSVEMENLISSGFLFSQFGGTITTRNSIVGSLAPGAGTQILISSQVLGLNNDPTRTTCVFSYNAAFQPLGPNCQ
jgi:hypothetical protein